MRIATWNVNSVRSRIDRVEAFLQRHDVDVLALQETKARDDQWPTMGLQALGYDVATYGLNQWNGVAIVSRVGLEDVQQGFDGMPGYGDPVAAEARAIGATCNGVRVWSLYVPNGRAVGDPHLDYKLAWLEALRDERRRAGWPRTRTGRSRSTGDWNIAPLDEDVFDIAQFAKSTHVTPPERAAFQAVVDAGYADVVRPLLPGAGGLHLLGLLPAALRAEPRDADRLRARLPGVRRPGHRGARSTATSGPATAPATTPR